MKKDRSNQKLTKADFEKFEYHDTRYYGLFYKKTENGIHVKIDPKQLKNTVGCQLSDVRASIINARHTHYFYPKKAEYYDYSCNVFVGRLREIQDYWEEHYKKLIMHAEKKIEKPKKVTPGDNMLLMQGIAEYDEAVMVSNWENVRNHCEYMEKCFEVVASLYASFIHQMASQIEAVTVLVLTKQNAIMNRFDRNKLYATAEGKNKKVTELPSFRYYDRPRL